MSRSPVPRLLNCCNLRNSDVYCDCWGVLWPCACLPCVVHCLIALSGLLSCGLQTCCVRIDALFKKLSGLSLVGVLYTSMQDELVAICMMSCWL
jgi:hypothetical protein